MKRRHVLSGILASGISSRVQALAQDPEISIRKHLIGAWKLVALEVRANGEVTRPYGEHPLGRLTYDDAGRTSAQVMKAGRISGITDPTAIPNANEKELRGIATGYIGYYGTFALEGSTVIHHIEVCTLPAWVGTDQRRSLQFVGTQLVLTFGPNKLVWERLPN